MWQGFFNLFGKVNKFTWDKMNYVTFYVGTIQMLILLKVFMMKIAMNWCYSAIYLMLKVEFPTPNSTISY